MGQSAKQMQSCLFPQFATCSAGLLSRRSLFDRRRLPKPRELKRSPRPLNLSRLSEMPRQTSPTAPNTLPERQFSFLKSKTCLTGPSFGLRGGRRKELFAGDPMKPDLGTGVACRASDLPGAGRSRRNSKKSIRRALPAHAAPRPRQSAEFGPAPRPPHSRNLRQVESGTVRGSGRGRRNLHGRQPRVHAQVQTPKADRTRPVWKNCGSGHEGPRIKGNRGEASAPGRRAEARRLRGYQRLGRREGERRRFLLVQPSFPRPGRREPQRGKMRAGEVHANGVESLWTMLKRARKGAFHKMPPQRMRKCATEFAGKRGIRETGASARMARTAANMRGKKPRQKDLARRIPEMEIAAAGGAQPDPLPSAAGFPNARKAVDLPFQPVHVLIDRVFQPFNTLAGFSFKAGHPPLKKRRAPGAIGGRLGPLFQFASDVFPNLRSGFADPVFQLVKT